MPSNPMSQSDASRVQSFEARSGNGGVSSGGFATRAQSSSACHANNSGDGAGGGKGGDGGGVGGQSGSKGGGGGGVEVKALPEEVVARSDTAFWLLWEHQTWMTKIHEERCRYICIQYMLHLPLA